MLNPQLLAELVNDQHDPRHIAALLNLDHADPRQLAEQVNFEVGKPYARVLLGVSDEVQVVLAKWRDREGCYAHDHGHSTGWVFCLQGQFVETPHRWVDGKLVAETPYTYGVGEHARVCPEDIHTCESIGEGLSLHIYYPRMRGMKLYDLKGQRTLLVSEDCGAWCPEPMQIIESQAWPL